MPYMSVTEETSRPERSIDAADERPENWIGYNKRDSFMRD